jgi:hypothetical protein
MYVDEKPVALMATTIRKETNISTPECYLVKHTLIASSLPLSNELSLFVPFILQLLYLAICAIEHADLIFFEMAPSSKK